jgi:hypothetical protein
MPTTAPVQTGAATAAIVSWRYIDANQNLNSFSLRTTVALASGANVNAVTVALAAASNASVYEVSVAQVWTSIPNAVSAVDAPYSSVYDNVVELFKDPATGFAQDAFIPAPLDALMNTGTTQVDLTNTLFDAFSNAVNALLLPAMIPVSARLSERRKTYKRVRI